LRTASPGIASLRIDVAVQPSRLRRGREASYTAFANMKPAPTRPRHRKRVATGMFCTFDADEGGMAALE
jgi:hypothetical protein